MPRATADLMGRLGLDDAMLRSLDRLALRLRRPAPGGAQGRRRSPRTGQSVEFADYRAYVPGDDVRRIDWSAYARSDRLTLRLTVAEEDSTTNLLVDCSRSMAWGQPVTKAALSAGLAAGLAWIALRGDDRACVIGFGNSVVARTPVLRGRGSATRLWDTLTRLPEVSASDPAGVVAAARRLRRGVSVVISDFLTEAPWEAALAALRAAGQEVVLLQVLAADEVDPTLSGDLRLLDSESGTAVDLTVTPAALARYRNSLTEHTERLGAAARAQEAAFLRVVTTTRLRDVLLRDLRQAGALRG